MFQRPEEIILAILGVLWIIAVYFITQWLNLGLTYTLEILIYNIIWVMVTFWVWKKEKIYYTWPIFVGLFVACWTPLLTWYAQKDLQLTTPTETVIFIVTPWYATWYFKLTLIVATIIVGYIILLIKNRKK